MGSSSGNLIVVWDDKRSDNEDIYAAFIDHDGENGSTRSQSSWNNTRPREGTLRAGFDSDIQGQALQFARLRPLAAPTLTRIHNGNVTALWIGTVGADLQIEQSLDLETWLPTRHFQLAPFGNSTTIQIIDASSYHRARYVLP